MYCLYQVVFPNARIQGCFFHFCQCILRKIAACGLKGRYQRDPDFALMMRLLPALAFIPLSKVVVAFEALLESGIFPPECREVLDYVEDTWIGRPNSRGQRRPPMFAHALWNCFEAVLQHAPKTNNSIEGWHRGFETTVDTYHANIYRLLAALKKEQVLMESAYEQQVAGDTQHQRKKYKDVADRLHTLVNSFEDHVNDEDDDYMTYLRGIAHNIGY